MIVVRAPLRVSLGGGGTDLPSYYERREGFLIAAGLKQHIFVIINQSFEPNLKLKYSRYEEVTELNQIRHPFVRAALERFSIEPKFLEISSQADIPSGTGLGSSGAFGVAFLQALSDFFSLNLSRIEIAEHACDIEINVLNEPSGKQDQYASTFGGLNTYTFKKTGEVEVRSLNLRPSDRYNFEDSLLMYFTGKTRRSTSILEEQRAKTQGDDSKMLESLDATKQIGFQSRDALLAGDLSAYGNLMHEHWLRKKQRSEQMTNKEIDAAYECARAAGAYGGKLIGAGGGGFLLFVCENRQNVRAAMDDFGLREVSLDFDSQGVQTIYR